MVSRNFSEIKPSDRLVAILAAMPDGVSAPALAERLGVSQPTLSRLLRALRARGLVLAEGQARSTRYHWVGGRGQLATLRRRRMHEWIALELIDQPELLDLARERLERIRATNPAGAAYHRQWEDLLSGPMERLLRYITEDGDQADALRKESPLTFVLSPAQRRVLFSQFRQDHESTAA